MKKIASMDFLIHVLKNDPKRSEYFRQSPPRGIRANFFFITDISKASVSDINADDNGAYLKSRNTNKFYYCENDRILFVKTSVANFIITKDCLGKVHIPSDKIVKLSRT